MLPTTRSQFMTEIVAVLAASSPLPVPSPLVTVVPRLEIYRAGTTASKVALTPDALITLKGVVVHTVTDPSAIAEVTASVDAAHAARDGSLAGFDAHWGLRFGTATGRFVHSVYCDAAGRSGQIDGRPVVFASGAELVAMLAARYGAA